MRSRSAIKAAGELVLGTGRPVTLVTAGFADQQLEIYEQNVRDQTTLRCRMALSAAVMQHGGREVESGDGDGVWLFTGPRHAADAVLALVRMAREMELFLLSEAAGTAGDALQIRLAAGLGIASPVDGDALFPDDEALARLARLRQEAVVVGEPTITHGLYHLLESRLQQAFAYRRDFEAERLYAYEGLTHGVQPTDAKLNELMLRLGEQVDLILARCTTAARAAVDGSALHHAIKRAYAGFRAITGLLEAADPGLWSQTFQRTLRAQIKVILDYEARLRDKATRWLVAALERDETRIDLRLARFSLAVERGEVEPALQRLRARFERIAGGDGARRLRGEIGEGKTRLLYEKVAAFAWADDDMARMPAFIELARGHAQAFQDFVVRGGAQPLGSALFDALWQVADLVLCEDAASARRQGGTGRSLFGVLQGAAGKHPLAALGHLLGTVDWCRPAVVAGDPAKRFAALRQTMIERGIPAADLDLALRAILVGHPASEARWTVAQLAPIETFWPTVAYHRTPVYALLVLTDRLPACTTDVQKIFFDCAKVRLHAVVERTPTSQELAMVESMLTSYFALDIFVESPYFDDLEALRHGFEQRGQQLGMPARLLSDHLAAVEGGRTAGEPPAGVDGLPLAVRRHLARQGSYVEVFAYEEDERIATELVPFITARAAERIVRYRTTAGRPINDQLLTRLPDDLRRRLEGRPAGPIHIPAHKRDLVVPHLDGKKPN